MSGFIPGFPTDGVVTVNRVLLKPSELTPATSALMQELVAARFACVTDPGQSPFFEPCAEGTEF